MATTKEKRKSGAPSTGAKPLSEVTHSVDDSAKLTGRETAIAALVEAAIRLFSTSGPDGVALRTIAKEAGVNYGLIHSYVGTKDDLLRLVFRSISEQTATDFASGLDPQESIRQLFGEDMSSYVRMLAWALLQGRDAKELLGRSPALEALTGRMRGAGEADQAERIAAVTALALGWQLFGGFLASGIGADDPDILAPRIREFANELLTERERPAHC